MDSKATQVTIPDVPACFSEKEWKLLQEWQKELYRNVMKEIHQALISLGPLIATTVCSLRTKEKQELCPKGNQESERRYIIKTSSSNTIAISDASRNREETLDLNNPADAQERHNCLSAGKEEPALIFIDHLGKEVKERSTDLNSDNEIISFCIKDEEQTDCIGHRDKKRKESATSAPGVPVITAVFSLNIKPEEETCLQEKTDPEKRTSADPEATTPVVSIGINEEGETYPIDIQGGQKGESAVTPAGNDGRSMNRKRSVGVPRKSTAKKLKANVVQNIYETKNPTSQVWPQGEEDERTAHLQMWCTQQTNSIVHQLTSSVQKSETYTKYEIPMSYGNITPCDSNPVQSFQPITYPENEKPSRRNSRAGAQPASKGKYACTECGRSFSANCHLIRHERIHTGERPYRCTICGKSFNQNGALRRHGKIHTGERPHQCNVCERSFNQKFNLLAHQNRHAGENPNPCNACGENSNQKDDLIGHQENTFKDPTPLWD